MHSMELQKSRIREQSTKHVFNIFLISALQNKTVKITNLLVSRVVRNSGNYTCTCNLIGRVGCYGYTCNYNLIIVISIFLSCLIDVQRSRISILIKLL